MSSVPETDSCSRDEFANLSKLAKKIRDLIAEYDGVAVAAFAICEVNESFKDGEQLFPTAGCYVVSDALDKKYTGPTEEQFSVDGFSKVVVAKRHAATSLLSLNPMRKAYASVLGEQFFGNVIDSIKF